MTSKVDEKIDELLDIQGEIVEVEKRLPTLSKGNYSKHEEQESDYKYSRENFYNLVERGQDAITGILDLAKESEHPRTYEVAGQLIKTVGEVTEKLADLQEKMKRLKEVPDHAPKNVTNALFVGSTKELQALLKDDAEHTYIEAKTSE